MTEAIICAPMRIEARAIRRGLRANPDPPRVIRTGYGTTRAADRAGELKASPFGQMVVMGVGAGLTGDLAPGDLVVGTEVGMATCLSAPLLAGELPCCAGVERAIEIVERALELQGKPVYVRKQIVHNTRVVGELEDRGAVFVDELDQVPDGATVVFSAHGVSPAVRQDASRRGLAVIDATCPLVSKVHAEARRFAADGYTVALIGHAGHEEVEGTLGEAPDSTVLVQTAQDVAKLEPRDGEQVAYLMQTTLSVDEATEVAGALRERFPGVRAPGSDDICYATTNRQAAVRAVAAESDMVLVAGTAHPP